jgi:hypothetical protein
MPSPIAVDTGFVLSVAAVDGMPLLLGERWAGRTMWPTDVESELRYRSRRPGNGVPAGLATKALNGSHLWLPEPQALTREQDEQAAVVAERLGGTTDRHHRGEAAAGALAAHGGGVVATEDFAAVPVLTSALRVKTTNMNTLLETLYRDQTYSEAQVESALRDLVAKGRPNVDGLTARDIIDGSWRNRYRRR